jgi:hypothetical protein
MAVGVLRTFEKTVSSCLTAFWLLVEEAAREERATSLTALLGAAVVAVAQVVVVPAALAQASRAVVAEAERKMLVELAAAVVTAIPGAVNRGGTGRLAEAAAGERRARIAPTVMTTEVVEAAEAATTAEAVVALAVVPRITAAMEAAEAAALPMLRGAPRKCASGKRGNSRRITA